MNCELAHERIVLAAYGELPDEQIHELERHLATCTECGQEREQLHALRTLAAAHPVIEPDPNFVTRSRIRLEEALDGFLNTLPPHWARILAGYRIVDVEILEDVPTELLLGHARSPCCGDRHKTSICFSA